jgi:Domain of unknown function (DUF4169)
MADIINLRKARKAKARADKETKADENRARFGRPSQEQMSTEATRGMQDRKLDAHRRDGAGEDSDGDDGAA